MTIVWMSIGLRAELAIAHSGAIKQRAGKWVDLGSGVERAASSAYLFVVAVIPMNSTHRCRQPVGQTEFCLNHDCMWSMWPPWPQPWHQEKTPFTVSWLGKHREQKRTAMAAQRSVRRELGCGHKTKNAQQKTVRPLI